MSHNNSEDKLVLTQRFTEYFDDVHAEDVDTIQTEYPEKRSLYLDWEELKEWEDDQRAQKSSPPPVPLYVGLKTQPVKYHAAAEDGLLDALLADDDDIRKQQPDYTSTHVRIENLDEDIEIRNIRANDINSLISVSGIVRQATSVQPKIQSASFECQRCGSINQVEQNTQKFQEPHECMGCERQGPFRTRHDLSDFIDSQILFVQESPEGLRGGETPEEVKVPIEDDATGKITAGDHCSVVGIMRLDDAKGSGNEKSRRFDTYLEGISIQVEDEKFEDMEIDETDKEEIETHAKRSGNMLSDHLESEGVSETVVIDGENVDIPTLAKEEEYDTLKTIFNDRLSLNAESQEKAMQAAEDTIYTSLERHLKEMNISPDDMIAYQTEEEVDGEMQSVEKHASINELAKDNLYDELSNGLMDAVDENGDPKYDLSQAEVAEILTHARRTFHDIYDKLVSSIAPAIHGYEREKLAIILQLFSGVTKTTPSEERIRGDIHMLLIGDPGTGKSQLLQYVQQIAPRAVYASGKGSSSAGLTAAAVQKDVGDGSEWTLEAGTLVLADGGVAAVDELDKMSSDDRSALHEGLEQGKITVNKAGINATLKSECAMLAAANPKRGRFDPYEPMGEQIDLEPALVSRFDLIFIIQDEPDEERDTELAQHILNTNYAGQVNTKKQARGENFDATDLGDKAKDSMPAISNDLLRKYIAYSQQHCFPEMTEAAHNKIKNFYVGLRMEGDDEDAPIPVTARKLEGLVRLSEASARVRLSDKITLEDAERAVELAESSLKEVGVDPETGEYDADTIETGQTKTQRDRIKGVKDAVEELEKEYDEGAPIEEVIEIAVEDLGMDEEGVNHQIEKLSKGGELYKPSKDYLRTL